MNILVFKSGSKRKGSRKRRQAWRNTEIDKWVVFGLAGAKNRTSFRGKGEGSGASCQP